MKILITGINGQVGYALMRQLMDHELIGITRQECDLTNPEQIKQVIDYHQPELIINSAAYTKVDEAEEAPELAFQINRDAPRVMAKKARENNIAFIHFSTDYVFNGEKEGQYFEDDKTNPLGVYGKSKLAGELAIQEVGGQFYIFRTSSVYSNIGHNFYLIIKRMSQKLEELNVVADQRSIPTSNLFIARQMQKIIPQLNENNIGIYHLVPDGYCSWYTFAKTIIGITNPNFNSDNLHPIKAYEYKSKAKRPSNSCLDNQKIKQAFMLKLQSWQVELNMVINEA